MRGVCFVSLIFCLLLDDLDESENCVGVGLLGVSLLEHFEPDDVLGFDFFDLWENGLVDFVDVCVGEEWGVSGFVGDVVCEVSSVELSAQVNNLLIGRVYCYIHFIVESGFVNSTIVRVLINEGEFLLTGFILAFSHRNSSNSILLFLAGSACRNWFNFQIG